MDKAKRKEGWLKGELGGGCEEGGQGVLQIWFVMMHREQLAESNLPLEITPPPPFVDPSTRCNLPHLVLKFERPLYPNTLDPS